MDREQKLAGIQGQPSSARNDAVLCALLLFACLLYQAYASYEYLTSFHQGIFDSAWRPIGRDFVNYWTAGVAVLDGMVPQIFDDSLFHPYQERLLGEGFAYHNWSYPPHILLLLWPLGGLPYLWGLAAWILVTLGLYLWAAAAGRRDSVLLLLALLLAPATYENLSGGQNGFLTGALLIGGLRLLGPRPVLAGVLFGVLTVKPQLGLLLPFALLAARQWRAIVSATVTAVALVGGSILAFGWESWEAYFNLVVPVQTSIMTQGEGIFLMMMPSAYIGMRVLDVEPLIRMAVQGCFIVTALAGVVWAFARSDDPILKFGVLVIGTFLASPYGFNYDMTTVSLAVALVTLRGLREGFLPGEWLILVLTWLLPTTVIWLNVLEVPIGSLILLVCFGFFLQRIRISLSREDRCGFTSGQPDRILAS